MLKGVCLITHKMVTSPEHAHNMVATPEHASTLAVTPEHASMVAAPSMLAYSSWWQHQTSMVSTMAATPKQA